MSARSDIIAYIQTHPHCTTRQIAHATGWKRSTIANERQQIRHVNKLPLICRPGYWTWSFASVHEEAAEWVAWMQRHIDTRYQTIQIVRRSIP